MTRELKGFSIIMLVYLAGVALNRLTNNFMPSSVLGMLILFILLQTKVINPDDIKSICNFVINNMMVLFVPITTGLMVSYKALSGVWLGAVGSILLSTIIVLIVVGILQQYLGRRWRR